MYLLWACLIWVLPKSRQWCLRMSPFFTIYGGILLILQYFAGFKVSFNELNFAYDSKTMEQIGISINDYQPGFTPLIVKVFENLIPTQSFAYLFLVILYDIFLVNTSTIYQRKTNDSDTRN